MFTTTLTALSLLALTFTSTTYAIAPESITGFNVEWYEDFSGMGLDSGKWNTFTAAVSNNEEETYTTSAANCALSGTGSFLIKPQFNNGQWTSCRIESKAAFAATPGGQIVVQARFKLGTAGVPLQGIWPAFWSLGQSVRSGTQWPACGEIDTFENINGGALGYGTVHCGGSCNDPTGLSSGTTFSYNDFHTWAHAIDLRNGDWTQQTITWYMDGQVYKVLKGGDVGNEASWQALGQQAMFLQLNVAVGGAWPGPAVNGQTATGTAAGMEILYVGVYKST